MTTTVTTAQVITVLKHLATGRQPDFVAQVTHLPERVVEDIADTHGWPDPEAVRKGIFDLTRAEQGAPTAPARANGGIVPGTSPTSTSAPRPDLTVAHTAPTPLQRPQIDVTRPVAQSANELIVAASRSPKKRTQALGVKVAGLLGDLSRILREEEQQAEAQRAAIALREKNAKRIAELEAELARLKGTKAPKAKKEPGERSSQIPRGVYPCDYCDRVLDTPQGRAAHVRRGHEGFNPHAVHQQNNA